MSTSQTGTPQPGRGVLSRSARDFVSKMALLMAFQPGLFAVYVVPSFMLFRAYQAHPELAALVEHGRPLMVLASVVSVAAWWWLRKQRPGGMLVLFAVDLLLLLAQWWAVYPTMH